MAIDTELAKRLRSYRNFKHLTQKDVAAHLNVPHSAISDIENGKRDITVSELKVFSNLYGRSVEEIMSGKNMIIIILPILLVYLLNFLMMI